MSLKINVRCDYAWPGKFHTCGAGLHLWIAEGDLSKPVAELIAAQGWTTQEKITPGGRITEAFCHQHSPMTHAPAVDLVNPAESHQTKLPKAIMDEVRHIPIVKGIRVPPDDLLALDTGL